MKAHELHPPGPPRPDGLSVLICTHNGEQRIGAMLRGLAQQRIMSDMRWEVIVVDNASTDKTAAAASSIWTLAQGATDLRIVHESRVGLMHARIRGIYESRYALIAFLDDDNVPARDWCQRAYHNMMGQTDLGACGGQNLVVPEKPPPDWFIHYAESLAVGAQAEGTGDVTHSRSYLWGAGLVIRHCAWDKLVRNGFEPLLLGRTGGKLTSGDDAELCFALVLSGWRLWYDSGMVLEHHIPLHRLTWGYMRGLYRGFGAMSVIHDAYWGALHHTGIRSGRREVRHCLRTLRRQWRTGLIACCKAQDGDRRVLRLEYAWGRLLELIRQRKQYARLQRSIRESPWCVK